MVQRKGPFFDGGWSCQGHGPQARRFFSLQPLQPILPMVGVSFRAQERSRTALLQRRRRRVLDGSEHGRTMIDSGGQTAARSQAARTKAFAARGARSSVARLSTHGTQTDAATIATRRAETRIAGLGRAGHWVRAIERGPTEGREPPKSFVSVFAHCVRLTDGGRCRAQGSLRGRIARLSDGLRREDASHVTHAVHPVPATVATRSICPSSRQGRLPLARKL